MKEVPLIPLTISVDETEWSFSSSFLLRVNVKDYDFLREPRSFTAQCVLTEVWDPECHETCSHTNRQNSYSAWILSVIFI